MPTLYTMPGTCSLACNIAVAWLDAPVEVHTMEYGDHKKDAYLAINPKGKVPAVAMDDGSTLTELPAIMAWLGAEHGGEGYARDTKLGREEDEALCWMSSEVHASYAPLFAPKMFAESEGGQDEVQAAVKKTLKGHYDRMEEQLSGDWYLGERSFADAFLYVLTRWMPKADLSLDDYPRLKAFQGRMEADGKVKLALKRQDMEPASG